MLVNEKICSKQFHISAWVSHIKNDYTSEKLKNLALIWFTSCCISSLKNICQTSSSAHFTSCHSWYFHAQITDATACPDMWFVKRQVLILFLWLIYVFLLDVYCASDENISSYESESFTGSILVTCWLLLTHVDFSVLYHTVRGQSVIKLYVIYNMLEVQLIKIVIVILIGTT